MSAFAFDISARDGAARTGVLRTARGEIRTPAFMPVGTAATVKALTVDQVKSTGADIILGNTYHLMLRPGPERLERLGGLHRFMRWDGPILTDSGGFQVMSLSGISKVTEEAVTFRSHIDGSRHVLTPERSIEIQADRLGADIVMQLDQCVSWPADEAAAAAAMRLSDRWGRRSKAAFGQRDRQALFGIQQGSTFEALRRESAERLVEAGFDGYAIGGKDLEGGGPGWLTECMWIPTDEERATDSDGCSVVADGLSGRRDVVLIECAIESGAPMARGAEGHLLADLCRVRVELVVRRDQSRDIDEVIGCGQLAGARVHREASDGLAGGADGSILRHPPHGDAFSPGGDGFCHRGARLPPPG